MLSTNQGKGPYQRNLCELLFEARVTLPGLPDNYKNVTQRGPAVATALELEPRVRRHVRAAGGARVRARQSYFSVLCDSVAFQLSFIQNLTFLPTDEDTGWNILKS